MQIRDASINEIVEAVESSWAHYRNEGNRSPVLFLNAYECSQGYGGPEEGGWWYDIREPVACIPIEQGDTNKMIAHLFHIYRERVESSRPHTSAAGGYDVVILLEEKVAEYSPEHAPRYE